MRLVFMGSPDFSVPILAALLDAGHEIACVYAQPPRPAGRGQKEHRSPVHAFAEDQGLAVRTPANLKGAEDQAAFADLEADCAVVAAYGLILPKAVLDAPSLGCINVHASLLPRWRGAAPIQRAILAGDAETGVTIMQVIEALDAGAMLLAEAVPMTPQTTGGGLHDALSALGARLIVEALDGLQAATLTATPQPEDGVTYAHKLSRQEGRLDWGQTAAELERRVRAFDPWPGTWFEVMAGSALQKIKVLAADVVDGSGAPGTVLDGSLTVACGDDALRLTRVQRPGKGPVAADAFLRGFDLPPGTVLE